MENAYIYISKMSVHIGHIYLSPEVKQTGYNHTVTLAWKWFTANAQYLTHWTLMTNYKLWRILMSDTLTWNQHIISNSMLFLKENNTFIYPKWMIGYLSSSCTHMSQLTWPYPKHSAAPKHTSNICICLTDCNGYTLCFLTHQQLKRQYHIDSD